MIIKLILIIQIFSVSNLYEIIITDYKNYAILYYCNNNFEFWVFSRTPTPNAQIHSLIFEKLRQHSFTNVKIYQTDQLNCPLTGFWKVDLEHARQFSGLDLFKSKINFNLHRTTKKCMHPAHQPVDSYHQLFNSVYPSICGTSIIYF